VEGVEDIYEVVEEVDEELEMMEDPSQPPEKVLAIEKSRSGNDSQNGYLKCQGGYFYTITFDNSESVFRGRKLFYSINVETENKCVPSDNLAKGVEAGLKNLKMKDLMSFVKELLESEKIKSSGVSVDNDERASSSNAL